ncbi:MAG: DUF975 family protein [Clostridia bacterium]|nr:DUF975 family protein [Clostridia bacterium]
MASSELRAQARARLRGRWGEALALSLVASLLGATSGFKWNFNYKFNSTGTVHNLLQLLPSPLLALLMGFLAGFAAIAVMLGLVQLILGGAATLGSDLYYIRLCRGEYSSFSTLFDRFTILIKALGLRLFMALFVFLWTLLLIIPGIIAGYRYAMAPYIMTEHPEIGIREAVDISKNMMNGYKLDLFVLDLSFIGWALLCILTCGIGFLWLTPYMQAAHAAFYLQVSFQGESSNDWNAQRWSTGGGM